MTAGTESWDDVPVRDCYTKVQGQPCDPRHGWASWLNTLYVCPGTRTPGVAVAAALDGDGRGVAAPTPPSPPVDTAGVIRCECPDPDHDCKNPATDDDSSPRLCTPCLYGCML